MRRVAFVCTSPCLIIARMGLSTNRNAFGLGSRVSSVSIGLLLLAAGLRLGYSLLTDLQLWDEIDRQLFVFKLVGCVILTLIGSGLLSVALFIRPAAPVPVSGIRLPENLTLNDKGQIISGAPGQIIGQFIPPIFANTISLGIFAMILLDKQVNWFGLVFISIFVLYSLLWLASIACQAIEQLRFGAPALTLDPLPAVTGGMLHGTLDLRRPLGHNVPYLVKLSCIRRITPRHGSQKHTYLIWQHKVSVTPGASLQGSFLDFRIDMPSGLPANEDRSEDYHYWELEIKPTKLSLGMSIHEFNIPVIAGNPNHKTVTTNEIAKESSAPRPSVYPPQISPDVVRISQAGDATVFHYPVRRHRFIGAAYLSYGTIITALLVSRYDERIIYMLLPFMLVHTTLAFAGLYYLTNTLRIEASSRELIIIRRAFGIPCVRRRASAREIMKITHRVIFTGKFRLAAILHDGREITVGDAIPMSLVEYLQRRLEQALQLKRG
jgi:hypothetical protein